MFFTNWVGADVVNPVVNVPISGRGKNGGWFGWAEDRQDGKLMRDASRARSRPRSRRRSPPKSRRKSTTR